LTASQAATRAGTHIVGDLLSLDLCLSCDV